MSCLLVNAVVLQDPAFKLSTTHTTFHLQANAVSDKLLDLRSCVYTGKNLADKVLSGALVADADFSNTTMSNVTLTKSYAKNTNFSGA